MNKSTQDELTKGVLNDPFNGQEEEFKRYVADRDAKSANFGAAKIKAGQQFNENCYIAKVSRDPQVAVYFGFDAGVAFAAQETAKLTREHDEALAKVAEAEAVAVALFSIMDDHIHSRIVATPNGDKRIEQYALQGIRIFREYRKKYPKDAALSATEQLSAEGEEGE
jgi:hypothetical protein